MLHDYVVGTYNARVAALVSELRLVASRADMRPVLLPSAVMLVATIGAATVSVTQQNWSWSILLGDFMGGWYIALVVAIAAFAADVAVL